MNILRTLLARSAGGESVTMGVKIGGKKVTTHVSCWPWAPPAPRARAARTVHLCPLLPENRNQTIILYISKDIYGATNYLHLDLFILFF